MVREVTDGDLDGVLELYLHLHETQVPPMSSKLRDTWEMILRDPNYHLIVNEVDGKIVSSCTCLIVPNLTHGVRWYAFIENVVTHADYRKRGLAGECLAYAKTIAERHDCYKMMLITGSKNPATLDFYRKAGYDDGRTAFYQSLE